MGESADEMRAGIDEAARKMTEARAGGGDCGAEAYRERLGFLHRVARRQGVEPGVCPGPCGAGSRPQAAG
jgi:hypothetical protein